MKNATKTAALTAATIAMCAIAGMVGAAEPPARTQVAEVCINADKAYSDGAEVGRPYCDGRTGGWRLIQAKHIGKQCVCVRAPCPCDQDTTHPWDWPVAQFPGQVPTKPRGTECIQMKDPCDPSVVELG